MYTNLELNYCVDEVLLFDQKKPNNKFILIMYITCTQNTN